MGERRVAATTSRSPRRSPSATRSTSSTPWEELPEEQQDLFLHGTNGDRIYVTYRNRMGRKRSYTTRFEGIVPNLERRYRETDSDWSREKIEEYMSVRPCPECKGARLRPESRAVHGRRAWRSTSSPRCRRAARARLARRARADRHRARDRAADPARDRGAAALPRQRRRRLPVDGPRGGDAVAAARRSGSGWRRRSARRSSACSTSSTSRRSACTSATTQRLIATLERLRDLGNTVLVVEHDEGTMRAADHLVDIGPGAGEHGGHVVAAGHGGARSRRSRSR